MITTDQTDHQAVLDGGGAAVLTVLEAIVEERLEGGHEGIDLVHDEPFLARD